MPLKLLKTVAIITSLPICGLILFVLILNTDAPRRTFYYFASNLNGTTQGTIVSSDVLQLRGKYHNTYHSIVYTYEVNGKQYYSDIFHFKERTFGNPYEITKKYPTGKEVLVWYDKDSPEIGVIETSGPTPALILITVLNLFLACAGFMLNPLMWIAFGGEHLIIKRRSKPTR